MIYALTVGFTFSIRPRKASVTSTGDTFLAFISLDSSKADKKGSSDFIIAPLIWVDLEKEDDRSISFVLSFRTF